jgi:hypothetical protein
LPLGAFEDAKDEEIGVSLQTPDSVRRLQRALYAKAKKELRVPLLPALRQGVPRRRTPALESGGVRSFFGVLAVSTFMSGVSLAPAAIFPQPRELRRQKSLRPFDRRPVIGPWHRLRALSRDCL